MAGDCRLGVVAIGVSLASYRPVDWMDRLLLSEGDPEYDAQYASKHGEHPQKDIEHSLVVHRRSSLSVL